MQSECYLLMLSDGDCWTVLGVYLDKPLLKHTCATRKRRKTARGSYTPSGRSNSRGTDMVEVPDELC